VALAKTLLRALHCILGQHVELARMVELQDGGLGSSGVFLQFVTRGFHGIVVFSFASLCRDIMALAGLPQGSLQGLHHRLRLELFHVR